MTARSQDEVLSSNLLGGAHGTEAFFILQGSLLEGMEGFRDFLNIRIRHQLTKLASNHRAQIAGVDKHGLALLRLVAADKPKTYIPVPVLSESNSS